MHIVYFLLLGLWDKGRKIYTFYPKFSLGRIYNNARLIQSRDEILKKADQDLPKFRPVCYNIGRRYASQVLL